MAALPNIGGALCSTPQSLSDPAAGVPCSNAASIEERKTWTQSDFFAKFRVGEQEPPKMYIWRTSPGDGQTSCKVWLASGERRRSTNEAKTRTPLKFAGVPKTPERISAVSGPIFAILCRHVEEILTLTSFFRLPIHALVAKI